MTVVNDLHNILVAALLYRWVMDQESKEPPESCTGSLCTRHEQIHDDGKRVILWKWTMIGRSSYCLYSAPQCWHCNSHFDGQWVFLTEHTVFSRHDEHAMSGTHRFAPTFNIVFRICALRRLQMFAVNLYLWRILSRFVSTDDRLIYN